MSAAAVIYKDAVLSEDSVYRYLLTRTWDRTKLPLPIIGLNPSTADAKLDDPTIRREMGFARAWGYGGIEKANLFAFRATRPSVMKAAQDPVGPLNNDYLRGMAKHPLILCAWGAGGGFLRRNHTVAHLLGGATLKCLGLTKEGHPRHPLYVKADAKLVDWRIA